MSESDPRDGIATFYGFSSFAELLGISEPLPMHSGDHVQCYVARHPLGHWFVWEDKPPPVASTDDRRRV